MNEMEDKLGAILGNPQLMQQIMSMAQSLGQGPPEQSPQTPKNAPDPTAMQKLFSIAQQAVPDTDQQNLLQALRPYLDPRRIDKLEKAMRAAKIAKLVSTILDSPERPFLSGR